MRFFDKLLNKTSQSEGIITSQYAMFRANLQHTGEYDNGGIEPTNTELWQFETGAWVFSSPALVNGFYLCRGYG